MDDPGPARRARENVTGIVSILVTGIWLAALLSGFPYWLPLMLFGYIVIVPITAILFEDGTDRTEWWDGSEEPHRNEQNAGVDDGEDDALTELRDRYARGELTDEQFERKIEKLLETDTLENVEDRHRDRGDTREREIE